MDERGVSDGADTPALAQPGETGWARAHVRVGEHYPLISVRSLLPAAAAHIAVPPLELPATQSVDLARYALGIAEALVAAEHAPGVVQVEATRASRVAGRAAADLVLRVTIEVTGAPQAELEVVARCVLVDRQALGELPPNVEVRVHSVVTRQAGEGMTPAVPPHPVQSSSERGRRPRAPRVRVRLSRPALWLAWPVIRLPQPTLRVPRPALRLARPRLGLSWPHVRLPRVAVRVPSPRVRWPRRLRLGLPRVSIRMPGVPLRAALAVSAIGTRRSARPGRGMAAASPYAPTSGPGGPAARQASEAPSKSVAPARRPVARRRVLAGVSLLVAVGLAAFLLSPEYARLAGWAQLASGSAAPTQPVPPPPPRASATQAKAADQSTAVPVPVEAAGPVVADALVGASPVTGSAPAAADALVPADADRALPLQPVSTPAPPAQATTNPPSVAGLAVTSAPETVSPAPMASHAGRLVLDGVPGPGAADWSSDTRSPAWLAADGYHLFARQTQRFTAVSLAPREQALGDVLVSATFRKTGGPAGGGYGIILRDQGPLPRDGLNQGGRYYVLEVGDLGQVGIWRREDDHWAEIMGWTPSAAVHPGTAENTLVARATGQQLTLFVNGSESASRTDAALTRGGVGVFLGGDRNEAVVTDIQVQSND